MSTPESRRVVASLPFALYARLLSLKLKTGRTLEALVVEAVELLTTQARQTQSPSGAGGSDAPPPA